VHVVRPESFESDLDRFDIVGKVDVRDCQCLSTSIKVRVANTSIDHAPEEIVASNTKTGADQGPSGFGAVLCATLFPPGC
jgi:hypothetical protein